jgi:hypothetical protein
VISTCANSHCKKPFHYLNGGRLYRFNAACEEELTGKVDNAVCAGGHVRTAIFFWLCAECSSKLTLKYDGRQLAVEPLASGNRGSKRSPILTTGEVELRRFETSGGSEEVHRGIVHHSH